MGWDLALPTSQVAFDGLIISQPWDSVEVETPWEGWPEVRSYGRTPVRDERTAAENPQSAQDLPLSPLPLGQNQSKVGTGCSCSLWPPWTWPSVPFSLLWSHSHPSRARRRLLPRDREALAPGCQSGRLELEQRSQSSQPCWGLRRLPCMKSLPVNPGIAAGGRLLSRPACSLANSSLQERSVCCPDNGSPGTPRPGDKVQPGSWDLETLLSGTSPCFSVCVCSILRTHFLHSLLGGQPWLPQLYWAFWSQPHPSHLVGSSSLP